jgi:hypothetical protein
MSQSPQQITTEADEITMEQEFRKFRCMIIAKERQMSDKPQYVIPWLEVDDIISFLVHFFRRNPTELGRRIWLLQEALKFE